MTAGTTRRNGISRLGVFKRNNHDGEQASLPSADSAADRPAAGHADPLDKTARKRVGRIVPAAGVAAALVVGAAAYGLVATSGHPQGAQLSADVARPGRLRQRHDARRRRRRLDRVTP